MAWNLFKKDKNELEDGSIEDKLDDALKKAKNDKKQAARDITEIKKWAADAIMDVYADFFPNAELTYYRKQYYADAFEKYDEYKKKYSTQIDPEMSEKCDRIVTGYLNQISLRESKMKLYEKLESEYLKTKQKLADAQKYADKNDNLQSHEARLKSLDDDSGDLAEAMTDNMKLDDITKEIEYKAEYLQQLEKLQNQFGDDSDFNNAVSYKNEIDKMLEDLD